jgi:polyhydroxyalkanoate synthesis regulator phasin
MADSKTVKKLISGLLMGGLLLGSSAAVLADTDAADSSSKSNANRPIHGPKMPGMQKANPQLMQSVLNELVRGGTITQAQSDAITARITQLDASRKAEMEKIKDLPPTERKAYLQENKTLRTNPLVELVTAGTLTQVQADAISQALGKGQRGSLDRGPEMNPEQMKSQFNARLSSLVEQGTITSDQSAAILALIAQQDADRKAEMEKIKDMTPTERKAYLQENKTLRTNPLAELVAAGTLTQAQADEVAKIFARGNASQGMNKNGPKVGYGHQGPRGK